jgi:hypothetical protein
MQRKVDLAKTDLHLRKVENYTGGLFVTLQAHINDNKVICPVCHEIYRCHNEGECFCVKCRNAYFAYY